MRSHLAASGDMRGECAETGECQSEWAVLGLWHIVWSQQSATATFSPDTARPAPSPLHDHMTCAHVS